MSDTINQVPSTTPDFTTEVANKLAQLFPEVVADGKVDIDKLKIILGVDVDDARERFGLTWPGKAQAIRAAQTPTTATLMPDKENSVDWDATQNVFIEGDNLEVLKVLQKHYYGQIKMIYIDPPYNTGNDFVYADNFTDSIGNYLEITGQADGGGRLSTNSESAGRFHSNWLNMMYPRLKLARSLLAEDGAIAVSIDDDELPRLRMMLDEIFGASNFYACICWQKKYSPANDAKRFSDMHDFILVYQRSDKFKRGLFPRTEENNKPYRYDDGDGRGAYRTGDLSVRTYSAANDYPIQNPTTGELHNPPAGRSWSVNSESMAQLLEENRIYWGSDGLGAPQLKRYLSEVQQGTVPTTWWSHEFAGHNDEARKEIRALFDTTAVFDTPKPTRLLRRLLQVCTSSETEDVVLDFFAGSGTTAHAVMAQNIEDGGNRRCISVQLPEPLAGNALNSVLGITTIADISRERIRRAGAKILEEESAKLDGRADSLDVGFRAYKLVDTNFTKWRADSGLSEDELVGLFAELADSADDHARPEALLIEVLLKLGFSLTEKIETVEVVGLSVFSVADGLVLAYLDEHNQPTLDQLRALVGEEPERLVVLEDAFQGNDELKTNLVQECRSHNVDLWTA
ncbi:site-specific DNA-methyltransferase [Arcanobacterium haemolyticum]|uniref:Site-specific DNA-methyltransferase (Adenine-specific) n=2 Tax=Arcanobacterium haemolyticum TaxID=28264 RepID=D7BNL2_ARCHD|nr:site-specific DNA-methyltransferase [Arcanobacterium haemolyticum]ADH92511.1 Site-specific DNA-methyltransferase (adenine-specific) [Arcanobacterium haemolyticum DSM 20595]SQH28759.1 putative methyltransferase [Arcanobacterium haemolyticum]